MATDVIREIDANFAIPEGLKDTIERVDTGDRQAVETDDIDIQYETENEDASELGEEAINDDLPAPDEIEILMQEIRTAPDGRQVVDVTIEVTDVPGYSKYDVRITKI